MRELISNSSKLAAEHSALPGVKLPPFPVQNIHEASLSLKNKKAKVTQMRVGSVGSESN